MEKASNNSYSTIITSCNHLLVITFRHISIVIIAEEQDIAAERLIYL